MNSLSFLDNFVEKRILITPLNWGLGHATRCIPIISRLQEKNQIILGSDGLSLDLLRSEFPSLPYIELPSYNIRYSQKSLVWSLIDQSHKITLAVSKEMAVVEELVDNYNIDTIISDHRLGCRDDRSNSIIIAHQIQIIGKSQFLGALGKRMNKYFINHFDECWIPDYESDNMSLAGDLSRPIGLKNPRYIGPLSRLSTKRLSLSIDVCLLISGPEPTRTEFEKRLVNVFRKTQYKIGLVKGSGQHLPDNTPFHEVFSLADTETLSTLLSKSKICVARSGYSTIMDLMKMQKSAILIPTPGQTEQEYLGDYVASNGLFLQLREDQIESKLLDLVDQLLNRSIV